MNVLLLNNRLDLERNHLNIRSLFGSPPSGRKVICAIQAHHLPKSGWLCSFNTTVCLWCSTSVVVMRKKLRALALFCIQQKQSINYQKTKVLVFAQHYHKIHKWQIYGTPTDPLLIHKYLGSTVSHLLLANFFFLTNQVLHSITLQLL